MNNYYIIHFILLTLLSINKLQSQEYSDSYINLIQSQIKEVNESFMNSFSQSWKTDKFTAYFSFYKDPTVNGIAHISTATFDDFTQSMSEITSYATAQELPFTWLTNYKLSEYNITEYLTNNGFTQETFDVMVYDLRQNNVDYIAQKNIRLIKKNEIKAWLSTCYEVFQGTEFDINFTHAWAEFMKKAIDENNKTVENYGGYVNNTIIATGTLHIYESYGYIANIATHNAYQRQGIATKILKTLISSAQQKGLDHVFLLTNTATQFYQKLGFKKISEIDYYTFTP